MPLSLTGVIFLAWPDKCLVASFFSRAFWIIELTNAQHFYMGSDSFLLYSQLQNGLFISQSQLSLLRVDLISNIISTDETHGPNHE